MQLKMELQLLQNQMCLYIRNKQGEILERIVMICSFFRTSERKAN